MIQLFSLYGRVERKFSKPKSKNIQTLRLFLFFWCFMKKKEKHENFDEKLIERLHRRQKGAKKHS